MFITYKNSILVTFHVLSLVSIMYNFFNIKTIFKLKEIHKNKSLNFYKLLVLAFVFVDFL